MKAISVAEMRRLEARSMEAGVSGFELMERAGRAAAAMIEAEFHRRRRRRVVVVAGKGNNAGDGWVAAAALTVPTEIFALTPAAELRGDAAAHAARLPEGIPVHLSRPEFRPDDLIVDALLGTGFTGELREPFADWIEEINASGCPVVSLDLPSGLQGDTGEVGRTAVRADLTLTFGLAKTGLFRGRGAEFCGPVRVLPIGIPPDLLAAATAGVEVFTVADARNFLGRPDYAAHKNSRGRVLILAGSAAYPGAAALAVTAAFAGGAGMVRLATPELPFSLLPAALIRHRIVGDGGCFGLADWESLKPLLPQIDAIVAGPGWGAGPELSEVVRALLETGKPLLLDADALNAVAGVPAVFQGREKVVVTPHPGEAARLFAAFGRELPADRSRAALELAALLQAVVVLKGPQTVVAAPDGRCSLNSSGSPALAVAGSGDVLSGLGGALLAEGREAFEAAQLAVFLHGLAGETLPRRGLPADRLPELIRRAMYEVSPVC